MAVFEVGKKYNFNTISNNTLPSKFYNAEIIINKTNFEIASKLTSNEYADLISIYEKLKNETNKPLLPPSQAVYVVFKIDDKTVALSYDWINLDTVTEVSKRTVVFEFNNLDLDDLNFIKTQIEKLGFRDFKIYFKDA